MRGLRRPIGLVAALVCVLALATCGGGGDDASDADALSGCLEDAGLKVETGDVGNDEASKGITDEFSVKAADDNPLEGSVGVQIAVFESSDQAEKYASDFSGSLKQVGSVLIFALDTKTKEYDQTVSCAEEASG